MIIKYLNSWTRNVSLAICAPLSISSILLCIGDMLRKLCYSWVWWIGYSQVNYNKLHLPCVFHPPDIQSYCHRVQALFFPIFYPFHNKYKMSVAAIPFFRISVHCRRSHHGERMQLQWQLSLLVITFSCNQYKMYKIKIYLSNSWYLSYYMVVISR